MPDQTTPTGKESKVPGNESEINDMVINAVLKELGSRGFSREDFPVAIVIGAAAMRVVRKHAKPSVPVENILIWLGQWRDSLSAQAVDDLQALCDRERK